MMGLKVREVTARHTVSLEDLVPADHFYRHLDRVLDLAFVRDLVRETYAPVGRPSIDPVVFFRLQLVLFFEGLRSERQLLRVVADRLSVRWYLGYDLGEALPDHSSLTRIRARYGLEVFRRFFEAIVERCQAAGLVWGKELYLDRTKVEANASLDSLRPRFFVEAHLQQLFRDDATPAGKPRRSRASPARPTVVPRRPRPCPRGPRRNWPRRTPGATTGWPRAGGRTGSPPWGASGGAPSGGPTWRPARPTPTRRGWSPSAAGALGYSTHYVVDGGKARVIVAVLVTPAEVRDNQPAADLLLVRPLPVGPPPSPGDRGQALRHLRAHRRPRGRRHPGLRASARLGPAPRLLRSVALHL